VPEIRGRRKVFTSNDGLASHNNGFWRNAQEREISPQTAGELVEGAFSGIWIVRKPLSNQSFINIV
jgi:hypothetical protein